MERVHYIHLLFMDHSRDGCTCCCTSCCRRFLGWWSSTLCQTPRILWVLLSCLLKGKSHFKRRKINQAYCVVLTGCNEHFGDFVDPKFRTYAVWRPGRCLGSSQSSASGVHSHRHQADLRNAENIWHFNHNHALNHIKCAVNEWNNFFFMYIHFQVKFNELNETFVDYDDAILL